MISATHRFAAPRLRAYHDGALADCERERVDAHLRGRARCQIALTALADATGVSAGSASGRPTDWLRVSSRGSTPKRRTPV